MVEVQSNAPMDPGLRRDDGFVGDGFVGDGFVGDGFVGDGFVGDGFLHDGSAHDGFPLTVLHAMGPEATQSPSACNPLGRRFSMAHFSSAALRKMQCANFP